MFVIVEVQTLIYFAHQFPNPCRKYDTVLSKLSVIVILRTAPPSVLLRLIHSVLDRTKHNLIAEVRGGMEWDRQGTGKGPCGEGLRVGLQG